MKNWISVSKEVPSESKIYNITYKSTSGRRRSDSAFYNSQKKIWYWDEEEEKEVTREIVAWASLPTPCNPPYPIYGAIIGDIVGSVYEFHNIKTKKFEFWNPKACFTDDTVMTIAVYEAMDMHIKSNGSLDLKSLLVNKMRSYGKKYPYCSYGMRFNMWLNGDYEEPYNSFGNGSAMRVSAAGFFAETLDEARQLARASAEVTHNHPEGIKGAESVATGIYLALSGVGKTAIAASLTEYWNLHFSLNEIRSDYKFDETCQGTVPQAIVAFLESTDFEDAIRNAVSLGGDSDTLAAITGSIAGAYYGIPDDMILRAFQYLDEYLSSKIEFY